MTRTASAWPWQRCWKVLLRCLAAQIMLMALLPSITQSISLRARVTSRNLLNARLEVEPKLFLPPKQFLDSKLRVVPFDSSMPKASLAEGDALKNKRYFLHYDYSQIFDRRALEGSNALLSMWPHNPGRAGGDASKERVSFMHFPDSAIKRCVSMFFNPNTSMFGFVLIYLYPLVVHAVSPFRGCFSASALSHSIFNDVASLRPLQDPPPLWGL